MKTLLALIACLVVALAVVKAEEEEEKSLFERFMESLSSCKEEENKNNNLNMSACFQTYVDGGDMSSPEIQSCKCLGACLSEKLETLKSDFTWDWGKMDELNEQVKAFDEDLYNENVLVKEKCKDDMGGVTDRCEAAYQLFDCSLKVSEKMKEKTKYIANNF